MNVIEYLFFCSAVIIMIATPGPVMLLVASAGLKGGYRKAFKTILGTNLASLVLITASILILKGILEIQQQWFDAIKLLGCAYIAYLGMQIVVEAWAPPSGQAPLSKKTSAAGGFGQGFMVAISNPKDIIFFASFFPQFIHVTPTVEHSLILLTLTWIVLDFATLTGVYLLFNRLSQSKIYPKLLMGCGLILIAVAVFGAYTTFF